MNNKVTENNVIPDEIIDSLVELFLPDIIHFFKTEDGQKEFQEWKDNQNK